MYTVDPSTQETEAGRSLEFDRGQSGLQRKFLDSQGYTEKPCVEKPKIKQTKKNRFFWLFFLKNIMCTGDYMKELMYVRQAFYQLNFILCPIFSIFF